MYHSVPEETSSVPATEGEAPKEERRPLSNRVKGSIVVALLLPRSMVLVAGMAGYVAGLVVMRGLGVLKVAQRLGVPVHRALPWRRLAGIGAAIAVSIAAAWLALTVTPASTVLRLLVGGAVFAVTYLPLVVRFELVPQDEIRRVLGRFIPAYR